MACTRAGHAEIGRLLLELGGLQRRILFHRAIHPALRRLFGRQFRTKIIRQALQVAHRLAGQFGQRAIGIVQAIAVQDGVRAGAVVLGARFMHVGDRGQTDFQALLGIVELLLGGRFVGLRGGQRFDGNQHIEVGRRRTRDQLLVGGVEVVIGRRAVGAFGTQVGDTAPVEDRLAQRGAVGTALGIADVVDVAQRIGLDTARTTTVVALVAHRTVELRQQRGTRLHLAFLGVQRIGLCDRQLGIPGPRQIEGLEQVGGAGAEGQGKGEREYEGATAHAGSLFILRRRTSAPGRHRQGRRDRSRTTIRRGRR